MAGQTLEGKTILITGAARRLGRIFALACAKAGANVVIHHAHSDSDAESLAIEIKRFGRRTWVFKSDLSEADEAQGLIPRINDSTPLQGLVNSAAIFESLSFSATTSADWNKHFALNLTAPFILSQAFANQAEEGARIVNILDWRAFRPGADHFPYTVSKSALAAMTKSMAISLAPKILVNGLALGAILPSVNGNWSSGITANIPMKRWANTGEVEQALLFLLSAPAYITGEIIHLDGGRHLV